MSNTSLALGEIVAQNLTGQENLSDSDIASFDHPRFPGNDKERWKYTNSSTLNKLIHQGLAASNNTSTSDNWPTELVTQLEHLGIAQTSCIACIDGRWLEPNLRLDNISLEINSDSTSDHIDSQFDSTDLGRLSRVLAKNELSLVCNSNQAINIVYYFSEKSPTLSQSYLHIEVSESCKLELNQYFLGHAGSNDFLHYCSIPSQISAAAELVLNRVNLLTANANLVCDNRTVLESRASCDVTNIDLGARLARSENSFLLAGEHSNAKAAGITLAHDARQADNLVTMIHRAGNAVSEQDYVSILANKAKAVFKGKVEVREGADGTDSRQSSRNLLLDDSSTINTMPELEIYADDVKCAHGATTGQLDETALFYLCSRGLSESEARDLLIRAFAGKTLSNISDDGVRDLVTREIGQQLNQMLSADKSV